MFSPQDTLRYHRHILMPEIGIEGQELLHAARVIIIGVGGLGCPAALYLTAAGVGTIAIMDGDNVELSNLQRQILHTTPELGHPKVLSAAHKLRALNPNVEIITHHQLLTQSNARQIFEDYDFVIDATDNITTKYLINDTCVAMHKPFCHGALLRFEAQMFTYVPGTSCLRCIFGSVPEQGVVPTCAEAGVMGPAAGMLGAMQATEAIKYICHSGQLITNRLLKIDTLSMQFTNITVDKNPECTACCAAHNAIQ